MPARGPLAGSYRVPPRARGEFLQAGGVRFVVRTLGLFGEALSAGFYTEGACGKRFLLIARIRTLFFQIHETELFHSLQIRR